MTYRKLAPRSLRLLVFWAPWWWYFTGYRQPKFQWNRLWRAILNTPHEGRCGSQILWEVLCCRSEGCNRLFAYSLSPRVNFFISAHFLKCSWTPFPNQHYIALWQWSCLSRLGFDCSSYFLEVFLMPTLPPSSHKFAAASSWFLNVSVAQPCLYTLKLLPSDYDVCRR